MFYLTDSYVRGELKAISLIAYNTVNNDKQLNELYGRMKMDKSVFIHSTNVAILSCAIGISYSLSNEELVDLYLGALFHDIGKIEISKSVLNKKGPLTMLERQYMETHPIKGHRLCSETSLSKASLDIIRNHHEKLTGVGYPDHFPENKIPLLVQIATVADMFEAMQADRCYRKALAIEEIERILKKDKGINQIAVRILMQSITTRKNTTSNDSVLIYA